MIDVDIKSEMLSKIVEMLITKEIKKKLGSNQSVNVNINNLQINIKDKLMQIDISGGVIAPTESVLELVKKNVFK